MKQENIQVEYQIVLTDSLSNVEIARLKEVKKLYGMIDPEFTNHTIRVTSKLELHEVFSAIATWLAHIGADGDIFCIQQIRSFYTGAMSPEIKELMRSKV